MKKPARRWNACRPTFPIPEPDNAGAKMISASPPQIQPPPAPLVAQGRHTYEDARLLLLDAICENSAFVQSLAASLQHAAWRGHDATIEVTVRQLIAVVKEVAATTRELLGNAEQAAP